MKRVPRLAPAGLSVWVLLYLVPLAWGQAGTKPVNLIVHIAPDAQLEIGGAKTKQTGAVRQFESPPIVEGWEYTYTLRATWKESGREFQAERKFAVRGGQTVDVDLRTPDEPGRPSAGSFTLVDPDPVVLEPGTTKKIALRIRRMDFQEPVKLTFLGQIFSVKFVDTAIAAGEESAEVEVTAETSAPIGNREVTVWASDGYVSKFSRIKVAVKEPPSLKMPPSLTIQMPAAVKLKPGEKKTLTVQVQRVSFEGPVTVKLEGIPRGVLIPEVTVPAGEKEARLEATAAPGTENTEEKVRVIATAGRMTTESTLRVIVPPKPPMVEAYLIKGEFAKGETALLDRLQESPGDDQARFGLGTLQFVRAVEHLGQSLYRYGLRRDRGQLLELLELLGVPILRLPVPTNPKPEALSYPAVRAILQDLIADLEKSEATLAAVQDGQVKLPLHLGLIRLDLDGDGKPDDRLRTLLARYMGGAGNFPADEELLVVFDRGDVAWFRGYCHLLMALAEFALAHDGQELFECGAHIFFANVETPHKFLTTPSGAPSAFFGNIGGADVVDVIAIVHLVRLPVKEPARMKTALTHLEKMLALSKETWQFILAETDDDHEWIPNPRQKGALGIRVNQRMVDSWLEFVEEAEAILAGKRLIPFWRGKEERGINLRRVFTEPRAFDLVLWFQGTAATPYLEKGPLTRPEVWNRLQSVFGGRFMGFAVWFN